MSSLAKSHFMFCMCVCAATAQRPRTPARTCCPTFRRKSPKPTAFSARMLLPLWMRARARTHLHFPCVCVQWPECGAAIDSWGHSYLTGINQLILVHDLIVNFDIAFHRKTTPWTFSSSRTAVWCFGIQRATRYARVPREYAYVRKGKCLCAQREVLMCAMCVLARSKLLETP